MSVEEARYRLLVKCPDCPGIVANISNWVFNQGANIIDLDQHSSCADHGTYFMRMEFKFPAQYSHQELKDNFGLIAQKYAMEWELTDISHKKRFAILVSKPDHALLELLWLWKKQELKMEITAVVSNHLDLESVVQGFGLPFHYIPITKETKLQAEAALLDLVKPIADYLILARYMQILSANFITYYPMKIINIHHSFLPAFKGADPYRQAHDHGVKVIGATAHYVTPDLDQGPIIEQDVARATHRHSITDLRQIGRDLERKVLARAIRWQIEDRIIIDGNKTVVFGS